MSDVISPRERDLIDAALAEGRARRIPRGQSGLDPDAVMGWREQRDRTFRRRRGPAPCPEVTERRARLRELVAQGLTGPQCAELLGVTLAVVHRDLTKAGIRIERQPWRAARDAQLREMAAQGLTLAQMGTRLGLSVSTVRNDLRALGLSAGGRGEAQKWAAE